MAARLLRKTGEAIKHSPAAVKRLMGVSKGKYKMELAQADDPFKVGLSYYVDYIGYETFPGTPELGAAVEPKYGEMCDKSVVKVHREKTAPFKRLVVIVSDQRLTVVDPNEAKSVVKIPLYRIAFCGSHTLHNRTFTFMEKSRDGTRLTCHVLACDSPTKAQSMVRVVAKAFQNVFLAWSAQQRREKRQKHGATVEDAADAAAPEDEPLPSGVEDMPAEEVEKMDVSEEEKERRHMHRTFSRRTVRQKTPDVLDTGALKVKPDDFDLDEASEYVEPVAAMGASGLSSEDGATAAE